MEIENNILGILKKDREGLTISNMANQLNVHRHTLTKYIYRLEGEEKIKIREVGKAKLCYLNGKK
ncbi:MAG: HTH domain-containing protein [Candidatus Aenigmarchaeota archaeon]|nr:HTH domain-containing protein [Candidatus Aenigmarchaeota archaeon]